MWVGLTVSWLQHAGVCVCGGGCHRLFASSDVLSWLEAHHSSCCAADTYAGIRTHCGPSTAAGVLLRACALT